MLPELRAERMKGVAARVKNEFDGDLRAALAGPITKVRKVLPACGRRAFQLPGRTGAYSERTRGKELQRQLPRVPAHD